MKSLYDLKELLCKELEKIAQKGELSAGALETIHKLTDTIKNIDKIEMLEEESGYSRSEGDWEARGSYGRGMSRGGGSYASGDSYESGDSYANRGKHYVRGHYSRASGNSRGSGWKDHLMGEMEKLLREAGSPEEREALQRCMDQIEKA